MGELAAMADGFRQREEHDAKTSVALAWLTAALSRVTDLPPLEDLLSPPERPDLRELARDHERLVAEFGGSAPGSTQPPLERPTSLASAAERPDEGVKA